MTCSWWKRKLSPFQLTPHNTQEAQAKEEESEKRTKICTFSLGIPAERAAMRNRERKREGKRKRRDFGFSVTPFQIYMVTAALPNAP
jgi:hypothetical protein